MVGWAELAEDAPVDVRADALEQFWRFVAERQAVWCRRVVLGEAPPWTDDEVLRRYRFTNVYRELDPGTQYAIHEILERDEPRADKVFNTMIYRLIGRSETHARLGFQRLSEFSIVEFEAILAARRDEGAPVFTGAYTVSGYAWMGGNDKVENVARLFGEIHDRFGGFYDAVEDAAGPESVYAAIRDLPGFGNFLSYQVLVDLLYPLGMYDGASLLPFSQDEWATAGPGAKKGLDALIAGSDPRSELALMDWLRRRQGRAFERLGVGFPWLRNRDGDRIELSLADVQNCLCEFYKYWKIDGGTGSARRRFRADDRRSVPELRERIAGRPISLEAEQYEVDSDV